MFTTGVLCTVYGAQVYLRIIRAVTSAFREKVLAANILILHQLRFNAIKDNCNSFLKIIYFNTTGFTVKSFILTPLVLLWNDPYHMVFSTVS